MSLFLPCLWAFLASATFCFVFELRRWHFILAASFTGGVSWLVYLLLDGRREVIRFLVATVAVAILAEIFARVFHSPATIFLVIGIIPLVPGGGIYYTMYALISGDMAQFVQRGLGAAASAGGIAVGCSLVSSVVRIWVRWRRSLREKRRMDRDRGDESS